MIIFSMETFLDSNRKTSVSNVFKPTLSSFFFSVTSRNLDYKPGQEGKGKVTII